MKKILTMIALATLTASLSYGQGIVTLQDSTVNISTNSANVGGTSGLMSRNANAYYFAVLTITDPSGSTTLPTLSSGADLLSGGWFFSGITGTNATSIALGGKINGINGTAGAAANNWAVGTTNFFVIVGWSATEGSDWTTISNSISTGVWADTSATGVFGYSSIGYGASTTSPALPFSLFGSNPGQISTTFTLTGIVPVPEPTTIALAGLGGVALLAFRRRKA